MNPTVDDLVAQAEQLSVDAWLAEIECRADGMDGSRPATPWNGARKRLGLR